jgi:hypothetical protein
MRKPIDLGLSTILRGCEEYYLTNVGRPRRRGDAFKRMQKALIALLRPMAELHSGLYPGYEADKDHAGYLVRVEPPKFFRVPYHVLPTFPTGSELDALWQVSRTIRSGDRSIIALSGSNVMRKVFECVGDVDFCEYFPEDHIDGFNKIASNMDGNGRVACLSLTFAGMEWRFPWGDDKPTKDHFRMTMDSSDVRRSTLKAHYVGEVDSLGVTEITNLIIAVDEDLKSAALVKTFAAQEAPLAAIDTLPNQMNDPFEMGRYINWLITSIEELSEKGDMRKCLKRCAALSRVLFLPEITNTIADLANTSSILLSHKVGELATISAILKPLTDDRSLRLATIIAHQLESLEETLKDRGGHPDAPARERFDDEAGRIVNRLLSYVRPGHGPSSERAA